MNEPAVDSQAQARDFPTKWYKHWSFPLIPHIRIREADEWNTKSFHFTWAFFRFWTLDAPTFGMDAEIDTYHIGAYVRLPYCKMGLGIHVPYDIAHWLHRKTWRRPLGSRK